jgi:hypothetical protein
MCVPKLGVEAILSEFVGTFLVLKYPKKMGRLYLLDSNVPIFIHNALVLNYICYTCIAHDLSLENCMSYTCIAHNLPIISF